MIRILLSIAIVLCLPTGLFAQKMEFSFGLWTGSHEVGSAKHFVDDLAITYPTTPSQATLALKDAKGIQRSIPLRLGFFLPIADKTEFYIGVGNTTIFASRISQDTISIPATSSGVLSFGTATYHKPQDSRSSSKKSTYAKGRPAISYNEESIGIRFKLGQALLITPMIGLRQTEFSQYTNHQNLSNGGQAVGVTSTLITASSDNGHLVAKIPGIQYGLGGEFDLSDSLAIVADYSIMPETSRRVSFDRLGLTASIATGTIISIPYSSTSLLIDFSTYQAKMSISSEKLGVGLKIRTSSNSRSGFTFGYRREAITIAYKDYLPLFRFQETVLRFATSSSSNISSKSQVSILPEEDLYSDLITYASKKRTHIGDFYLGYTIETEL